MESQRRKFGVKSHASLVTGRKRLRNYASEAGSTDIFFGDNMLHIKLEHGCYYGVSQNCHKTHVLLQLGDEFDQVRVPFTPQKTKELIKMLERSLEIVEEARKQMEENARQG